MRDSVPSIVRSFSRTVRLMTLVFLGTAVFGTLLMSLIPSLMFGVSRHDRDLEISTSRCGGVKVSCSALAEQLLDKAVVEQQAAGRICTTRPSMSDVVLFQYSVNQRVAVLTFDKALAASGQKLGWVQRYCR